MNNGNDALSLELQKNAKDNTMKIIGGLLELSGIFLFGFMISWWAAFAIFLILWARNIRSSLKYKEKSSE